ncbi:glycosyltransferase family 4 protein [Intrasporangium chromatireducens]|uniref:glycosyltransferase family 4 protein n=1 Tax=Intrasporangium chromatireducens TaxID=1386088 RepID=UPI001F0A7E54|nr:glycosyltransferase family 4 protein [Intrasporangium chromatireducens]
MYPTRAKSFQEVGVKGHETFIDAAALARTKNEHLRFFIVGDEFVGDGSYRRALQRRAENRGVSIEFLGHLDSMSDFLPAMDILSNPSVSESASYTVIEAALARRPVAATDVGGLTDSVIHGETGILVPAKDAQSLADAFLQLADDAGLRERLGQAGRRHVISRFDIATTTSDLERVYAEAQRLRS